MKTKNFHDYLKTRLTCEEIAEIERQAQLEVDILKSSFAKTFIPSFNPQFRYSSLGSPDRTKWRMGL